MSWPRPFSSSITFHELKMMSILAFLLSTILIVQAQKPYPVRQLYQFPNDTFTHIENIAVRQNGQLLLTLITAPEVYSFDPGDNHPSPKLLYTFPHATSLTGIAETAPDVFAVVAGNYTHETYQGKPGSFSVWSIDMNPAKPRVKHLASVPGVHAANGMTVVDGSPDMILMADSALGLVWSLNTTTGEYQKAFEDPHLAPTDTFPLGVNGIRSHGRTLYFTNSAQGLFGSVAISRTGRREGNVSIIAHSSPGNTYDDFAIDAQANAWITNHPDAVTEVSSQAGQRTVAVFDEYVQPTAAAFGKGHCRGILYVVTGGQESNTSIVSGRILAINTG